MTPFLSETFRVSSAARCSSHHFCSASEFVTRQRTFHAFASAFSCSIACLYSGAASLERVGMPSAKANVATERVRNSPERQHFIRNVCRKTAGRVNGEFQTIVFNRFLSVSGPVPHKPASKVAPRKKEAQA